MKLDITKLLTNQTSFINIESSVDIPKTLITDSRIDELKNITLDGKVKLDEENELILSGSIQGTMTLKDDLTLEPVEYTFKAEIEEELPNNEFVIDITDILWQNILTEIPSKVRATDEDVYLSGDGWRVISEEQFNEERNKQDNPFAKLNELLKTKEDK